MRELQDLKGNEDNPRTITPAKAAMLKRSLTKFGDLSGIIFNRARGRLVGGHQRIDAFKAAAKTKVTVERSYEAPTKTGTVAEGYVDIDGERFAYREVHWPDEQMEKAANLAANKGAGEWAMPKVSDWLQELSGASFEMDLTMFDQIERQTLILPASPEPASEADEQTQLEQESGIVQNVSLVGQLDDAQVAPSEIVSRAKPGEVYALGRHRLMCGSSTDAKAVAELTQGKTPHLVVSSPPYAQARDYGALIPDWLKLMVGVFDALPCTDDTQVLINLGIVRAEGEWAPYWHPWLDAMRERGWRRYGLYIWDQVHGLPGRFGGLLTPGFELVFHLCKNFRYPNKTKLNASAGRVADKGFTLKGKDGGLSDPAVRNHVFSEHRVRSSVITAGRNNSNDAAGHPAPFSIAFVSELIAPYSNPGEIVHEPFSGSGTTLMACEQMGRTCHAMELEPRYVDIALARFEKLTGQRAQLVSRGMVADDA